MATNRSQRGNPENEVDTTDATPRAADRPLGQSAPTQNNATVADFPQRGRYQLIAGAKHSVVEKVKTGENDDKGNPIFGNQVRAVNPGDIIELSAHQGHAFRDKFVLVEAVEE